MNDVKGGRPYQITVFLIECVCQDALEEVVESLTEEGAVGYTTGRWRPIQGLMEGLTRASNLAGSATAQSHVMLARAIQTLLSQERMLVADAG